MQRWNTNLGSLVSNGFRKCGCKKCTIPEPFSSEMTAAKLLFYPIMEYFPGEFMLPVNLLIYRPKINGYQDGRRSGNFVSSSISTGFRI